MPFFVIKPTRCTNFSNLFCRETLHVLIVLLSIIRVYSLYTQQWYMSYRFVDSFRAGPGWNCTKALCKHVWHIPLLSVQWINSWWMTEELSETYRFTWQNKFLKLVHLIGFFGICYDARLHERKKKSYVSLLQVHDLIIKPVGEPVWRCKLTHVTHPANSKDTDC